MAKICISGYYGFKNFGDEAILSVLVNHFKNHDITVFSSNPEFTSKTYNVNSVRSFDIKKVIDEIQNCDVLISGGGSLLQDVTSLKSLVYYTVVIALGILFNKKVIIFAQGIGPINNKFAQIVVKNLLKLCNVVTVRDEKSLFLLNKWGVKAELVCDPIYSLEIPQKPSENIIGVQLRDFKTMNDNLLQKLALLICNCHSEHNGLRTFAAAQDDKCEESYVNFKVHIFSLQEALDLAVCKRFEHILKSFNSEIETEIVTDDIINRISQLEYLFAMRFHAVLCALKCGVKTCAINYDIKVEKLAQEASIPLISMDAHENMEEIYSKLQKLNKDELLSFVNSKTFDWSVFDELFTVSE